MSKRRLFALCFAFAALAACGGTTAQPVPSGDIEVARSALPRDTSPSIAGADLASVEASNLAFSQGLYGKIAAGQSDNVFFSPISVTYALSMTWAGARGDTAKEMADALHFSVDAPKVHAALDALDLALAGRGKGATGKDGEAFRLRVVNSVWGERDTAFEAPFLDTLATDYGAGVNLVDFVNQADPSRVKINDWVAQQTEGKIKELLAKGTVTPDTQMVLVNAVYFNGAWLHPFEATGTHDQTFHAASGDVTAAMMHVSEHFGYAKGDGFEAVSLPYADTNLELVVVMPPAGGSLATLEPTLDAAHLGSTFSSMKSTSLYLSMPKFKIAGDTISLKSALQALGIHHAFADADFSGICKKPGLAIGDVLHKAYVDVDENGTEAAAATAVGVGATSVGEPPLTVSVDRPFAFFLRDVPTNTILFAGHVTDPTH